ncbi:cytochrome c biogenesis protein CcsA [Chryseobacterium aurantiacum]|uniref:cytochrome c biogenesis protein CcsA n=1 Tax=Chryseobacterium aurantiacum TaxID=2116499 RepID=UPI000D125F3E|nr:cytochrome c biogenesis protein CcsA [Chryseobacterium aurantiacum]
MWYLFDIVFYAICLLSILTNVFLYLKKYNFFSLIFFSLSTIVIAVFIALLWINLERPPLRTLAETRLWYSFFIGVIGISLYVLYRYKWILSYAAIMMLTFLGITYFNPDTFNKSLMPALHSIWFIPHVVVYIFAYAMFGMATLLAVFGIFKLKKKQSIDRELEMVNKLINIGYTFLTLGLLFGALWAKEAWGHYWTWDPKETWAFITWIGYLLYIHIRYKYKNDAPERDFYILILAFTLLLICWFGVNYLPSASNSVHTYSG